MAPYIYGSRNNIHIIDLTQTVPLLHQALVTVSRHRRQGRPRAVRRHQAPGVRGRRRRGQVLRAVLRQSPLARRHADQLADDLQLDRAAASRSRSCWPASTHGLTKKELLQLTREQDKLERVAWRHQGHGRAARPDVRHRHQQGSDRHRRGAQAATCRWSPIVDSNCDPDGISHPDPRQRRRRPRHHALLRSDRARRASTASSAAQGAVGHRSRRRRGARSASPRSRATKAANARPQRPTPEEEAGAEPTAGVRQPSQMARGPRAKRPARKPERVDRTPSGAAVYETEG